MRSRYFRLVGGAAVCVGAAGALLLSTDLIERVARWDVSAFRGLSLLAGHPHVAGMANRVVHLADPVPTVAMLGTILAAGLAWGRPRHAAAGVLLVGGAAITGLALKAALAHPRYQALLGPDQLAAEAFPSGHAITAMAVALAAVLVTPPRWRPLAAAAGACYSLAAGVSLVIIEWHYPSDVLGGFLVAGSFGLLAVAAVRANGDAPKPHGAGIWPFARPIGEIGRSLMFVTGAAAVTLLVTLTQADQLLSYAAANTSAAVAAMGIALASAALVYGIAAEVNGR
jgi:membrane-associated phospholipid phosphatase